MKKLCFALVILLGLQIGTARADRLSQIMFPMDFIEAGNFNSTVFSVEDYDGHPDILAVKIRGEDFTNDTLFILPTKPEEDLYARRGELNGVSLSKDDLTREEAIEAFVDFCGDDILVAFNAFNEELPELLEVSDYCGIAINNRCVDLTWLARIYFQALKSYSFETLCRATEFPNDRYYIPDVAVALFKGAREVYNYSRTMVANY